MFDRNKIPTFVPLDSATLPIDQRTRADLFFIIEPITRTLGEGRIAVPDGFFKVVLCLEGTPKAIGFLYKNAPSSQSIKDCVCSVDSVEVLTGFDFFYSLLDDIEDVVESDANLSKWN